MSLVSYHFEFPQGFKIAVLSQIEGRSLMVCQDCLKVRPFDCRGHDEQYFCSCGGQWCGCSDCHQEAAEAFLDE